MLLSWWKQSHVADLWTAEEDQALVRACGSFRQRDYPNATLMAALAKASEIIVESVQPKQSSSKPGAWEIALQMQIIIITLISHLIIISMLTEGINPRWREVVQFGPLR